MVSLLQLPKVWYATLNCVTSMYSQCFCFVMLVSLTLVSVPTTLDNELTQSEHWAFVI